MARYVVLALVATWTVASLPIGLAIWPPAAGTPPPPPHDALHRSGFGRTIAGVAAIDIAFHTTLILGTAAVAVFFIPHHPVVRRRPRPQPAAEPAVPTA